MKNRWLIALSGVGIHLSIGSVYAWSVFSKPLQQAFGWNLKQANLTFGLAIFMLGMSAAVMGHVVERRGRALPAASPPCSGPPACSVPPTPPPDGSSPIRPACGCSICSMA